MLQAPVLPNPIRSLDLYSSDTRHSPPHPPPATPHPDHLHRHTELQHIFTPVFPPTLWSTSCGVWCVPRHHEYQTHLHTHTVPRSQSSHTHISYWKVCGVVWSVVPIPTDLTVIPLGYWPDSMLTVLAVLQYTVSIHHIPVNFLQSLYPWFNNAYS